MKSLVVFLLICVLVGNGCGDVAQSQKKYNISIDIHIQEESETDEMDIGYCDYVCVRKDEKELTGQVIGLPGDVLEIIDNVFYINGEIFNDSRLSINGDIKIQNCRESIFENKYAVFLFEQEKIEIIGISNIEYVKEYLEEES